MTNSFFNVERTNLLLETIVVDIIVVILIVLKLSVLPDMDWMWVVSPIVFSLSVMAIEVIVCAVIDTHKIMKERNNKDHNDL